MSPVSGTVQDHEPDQANTNNKDKHKDVLRRDQICNNHCDDHCDDYDRSTSTNLQAEENAVNGSQQREHQSLSLTASRRLATHDKVKRISRADMLRFAQDAVNKAQTLPVDKCNAVAGLFLLIKEEGESTGIEELTHAADSALSSRALLPLAGPEASKCGTTRKRRMVSQTMSRNGGATAPPTSRPRKKISCGFCTGSHSIPTCASLKRLGRRQKSTEDLMKFISTSFSPQHAICDSFAVSQLLPNKNDKPLSSLPKGIKWMCIHGLYVLEPGFGCSTSTTVLDDEVAVKVSCFGHLGAVIGSQSLGGQDFSNRMAGYGVVRAWMTAHPKNVIIDNKFGLPPMLSSNAVAI